VEERTLMKKILETRAAPNPRRVRIFLAEKGVTVPFEELDLMKGALKSPAFTELNWFQRVPVLILDDGTAIAETIAICRYVEEQHPEPALFGKGALGRAMVEMWNRRMELGLFLSVAQAFRHLHPAMAHLEVPQVAAWGEANKPRVLEVLGFMDRELATRRFIAGDEYSVADITALVAVDFMKPARIQRPAELKNLERWYLDVSCRPSAKA
jgi:glutathione S-transferase